MKRLNIFLVNILIFASQIFTTECGFATRTTPNSLRYPSCHSNEWKCDNGQCIRHEELCDGKMQCKDGSDETISQCLHRPCPDYAFQCAYGGCITGTYKCDGKVDCVDGSDESRFLCNNSINYAVELQANCGSPSTMKCSSGECIPLELVCDGTRDCFDASDETTELCSFLNCPRYAFRCGYGACIAGTALCNGITECYDNSDELPEFCGSNDAEIPRNTTDIYEIIITSTTELPVTETVTTTEPIPSSTPLSNRTSTSSTTPKPSIYCPPLINGFSAKAICSYNREAASCWHNVRPNTKAELSCNSGYILDHGLKFSKNSTTLFCSSHGKWSHTSFHCSPICGVLTDEQRNNDIKPWDVTILRRSFEPVYAPVCSGVIVSEKIVLTAASCVDSTKDGYAKDPLYYNVIEGHYNNTYHHEALLSLIRHNLSKLIIKKSTKTEDLAMLVLVNYFQFTAKIKPICLPAAKHDITLLPDAALNVGRAVARNSAEVILESLIARVEVSAQSLSFVTYVNIQYYLTFIKREIKRYQLTVFNI